MSTLKTTNIQHPSAGSPNLVLAADGSVSGGAGLGGLVLLDDTSFSGVSSVAIDNVFSADYLDYLICLRVVASSASTVTFPMSMRRADQSTYSGATYSNQAIYGAYNTTVSGNGGTGGTSFPQHGISSAQPFSRIFTLSRPYASEWTIQDGYYSGSAYGELGWMAGQVRTTESFTGYVHTVSSGTVSGSIQTYGYAND
jgi:hypothetical protein